MRHESPWVEKKRVYRSGDKEKKRWKTGSRRNRAMEKKVGKSCMEDTDKRKKGAIIKENESE